MIGELCAGRRSGSPLICAAFGGLRTSPGVEAFARLRVVQRAVEVCEDVDDAIGNLARPQPGRSELSTNVHARPRELDRGRSVVLPEHGAGSIDSRARVHPRKLTRQRRQDRCQRKRTKPPGCSFVHERLIDGLRRRTAVILLLPKRQIGDPCRPSTTRASRSEEYRSQSR